MSNPEPDWRGDAMVFGVDWHDILNLITWANLKALVEDWKILLGLLAIVVTIASRILWPFLWAYRKVKPPRPKPQPETSAQDDSAAIRALAIALAKSEQEKREAEKALAEANAALKQAEKNPPAGETAGSIEAARQRLLTGDTADAKLIFTEILAREERLGREHNRNAAEACRNLAALAFLDNSQEAARLYAKAVELDPEDWSSLYRLALVQMRMGNLAAARGAAERLLALRNRINDPHAAYYGLGIMGDLATATGNLAIAERHYRDAVEILARLSESDPANPEWQRDLSVSHDRIGDVERARGDLAAALASYKAALAIRERLAKADPGNAEWQRDLSVSHNKIGDVERAQGDLAAALASYKAALAILERLAKADPDNAGWQRDLSVSHDKIGDVERDQGDLAAALASYKAALAIGERLAKADPDNAGWQRDLSVSHNKIGDVERAQGDLAAALASYKAALAIARAPGQGRSGQCRMAARSLRLA